jgi:hypothetical protein
MACLFSSSTYKMTVITQPRIGIGIGIILFLLNCTWTDHMGRTLHIVALGFLQESCDIINYMHTSVSIKWRADPHGKSLIFWRCRYITYTQNNSSPVRSWNICISTFVAAELFGFHFNICISTFVAAELFSFHFNICISSTFVAAELFGFEWKPKLFATSGGHSY